MPLVDAKGIQASKYTRAMQKGFDAAGKTGHAPAFDQHKRAEKCVSRIQLRTGDSTSSRPKSIQISKQSKL